MSDRLTFGIDKGGPNGDMTALTIKRDDKVFTFVGTEAEVILEWHEAEVDKARRESKERVRPIYEKHSCPNGSHLIALMGDTEACVYCWVEDNPPVIRKER